ncbi:MAG: 50S ribosomal protein L9 [Patescibacteria group bacterium]
MKVLLLCDIPKLGRVGEIKEVKEGYARNYLIPNQLATYPTQRAIERVRHESRKALERRSQEQLALRALAQTIQKTVLPFKRKATPQGLLYGGIHSSDILHAFQGLGIQIPHQALRHYETIKTVGKHTVSLHLPHDIQVTFFLEIEGE